MTNEELAAVIQNGDTERMGELWEQIRGLVAYKARHIMSALELRGNPCGVELDDLIQSGYIALVKAVHYYHPESGAAFSTCLGNCLKTVFADITGYRTAAGRNEPLNNAVSLDKTVDDEDGSPFGEFVPDPKAADSLQSAEERLWRDQLRETMAAVLEDLPQKQKCVLHGRYWLNQTLEQVGADNGISKQQAQRVESQALWRLRRSDKAKELIPFADFNFYTGTGLGAFRSTGTSIQERYLIAQEERAERRQNKKTQQDTERIMEQLTQEAERKAAGMTLEEKRLLLEQYGFA